MENNTYGYVCIYNNQRIELYASSSYSAQELAVKEFQKNSRKKVKGWDVIVILAEVNGEEVIHNGGVF